MKNKIKTMVNLFPKQQRYSKIDNSNSSITFYFWLQPLFVTQFDQLEDLEPGELDQLEDLETVMALLDHLDFQVI